MSTDELAVMDGGKCILQVQGVRPFFSDKYDITKHPQYKYLSDYNKKNTFDLAAYIGRRLKVKESDVYEVHEYEAPPSSNQPTAWPVRVVGFFYFGGKHNAAPYSLPHRRVGRRHSPRNQSFFGKETLKSRKGGLCKQSRDFGGMITMAFFTSAVDTLKVLVIAIGAGLGVWGVINLLEGYGNDNPSANAQVP